MCDLAHGHNAFIAMCDADQTGACRMDGAAGIGSLGPCLANPQFRYVAYSSGALNPYLELVTQYGWANYMFQTNQGASFPAHQFLFGATSAPTAVQDAAGVFAVENPLPLLATGCTAIAGATVALIDPSGSRQSVYPCFEHSTVVDVLPPPVTWRYYTPGTAALWAAPIAIQHICQSTGPNGTCNGSQWTNVDPTPADVLTNIGNCALPSVSWVIPTGADSDHAGMTDGSGPSWVASIVNAIGTSTACDGNTGYWNNTAILITWDDWGGWYDHEPPSILPPPQGDYQYGFRVPLLVVSAYTPAGYIDNTRHDFGSIVRFIEHNFGIPEGVLNFADARASDNLGGFFRLNGTPRRFQVINAPLNADFFLNDKRPLTAPDDD
jgi:phospholipase C